MLSISTLPEALITLSKSTGYEWTESELFDLVTKHGVHLHAVVPPTVGTSIQCFEIGQGLVEKYRMPPGHSLLAVLFPFQVARLWMSGEAETMHPSDHDAIEGEYKFLTEPITATKASVRIKAEALDTILRVWSTERASGKNETTTGRVSQSTSAQRGEEWSLRPQERVRDPLATMIYDVLKAAYTAGEPCPKARDVMNAIAAKKPRDFVELLDDEIKVIDAKGDHDSVSSERIRARIDRMTER
jgi:hypothetical protein